MLETPAVVHALAGTTAIWKPPARSLSMIGASEPGTGASALALYATVTVIDPLESDATCDENSPSGRLLGRFSACESATVMLMGAAVPPAFAAASLFAADPPSDAHAPMASETKASSDASR